MQPTLAKILKARAEELEGKWVALVLEEFLPPLPVPAGTAIQDVHASDVLGDPISGFEVLCESNYEVVCVGKVEMEAKRTEWYLVSSGQPFAVRWYEYSGTPTNIKLIKGQQVSRGELGRYPDVPMPRFT